MHKLTKILAIFIFSSNVYAVDFAQQTFNLTSSGIGSVGYLSFNLYSPTYVDIATSGPAGDPYIYLLNGSGNFSLSSIITFDDDGCNQIDCGAAGAYPDYNSLINDYPLSSGSYTVAISNYLFDSEEAVSGVNNNYYSGQVLLLVGDSNLIIPGTGLGTGSNRLISFAGGRVIPSAQIFDPLSNTGTTSIAVNDLCATTATIAIIANCNAIAGLAPAEQAAVIEQITPDQINVISSTTVATSRGNFTGVMERIGQLRAGNIGGIHLSQVGGAASSDELPEIFKQLGVFANIDGGFGNRNKTINEQSYNFDTQAVTVGVDYAFNDSFVVGAAFNNTRNNANFLNQAGQLYTASYSGSLFSSYNFNNFYIDSMASVGGLNYNSERQMSFFNTSAKGVTTGMQYASSLNVGYNHQIDEFIMGPYAGFDYTKTEVDGFSESGGAGFAINYGKQDIESILSKLGARASYTWSLPWGVIAPQINAEWLHESSYNASANLVRFVQGTNTSFAIHSDAPDRDFMRVGFNVSGQFANGLAGYIAYNSLVERRYATGHAFTSGIRLEF